MTRQIYWYMSMLLSSTEITLQIHILTFSLVLTVCLFTTIRILWYQFFSHSLCVDHTLVHVTRETYRVSPYFLDSVPPKICSLVCSDSAITRNRAKGFWCALTVWMHCQTCANASSKKSASHVCEITPFTNFAIKAFYGMRNNNYCSTFRIIVPYSVKCFYGKVGKRSALTKIKSVTVGGRMTRNDPDLGCTTSCSSPKYVAGAW